MEDHAINVVCGSMHGESIRRHFSTGLDCCSAGHYWILNINASSIAMNNLN